MIRAPSQQDTLHRSIPAGGHVEAVSRAARVLKAFESGQTSMSIRQIAEKTGIARSTCHSMVATLVAEGLLEARHGAGYQLGSTLAHLGGLVLERSGLVERATPHMEVLSSVTGGEVHLAQSVDEKLIYLARVRRDRRVNMPNRFGRPVPLYATGCGWAILLARDHREVEATLADVPHPRRRVILEELNHARARGFVVHNDFALGTCSIAVPIPIGRNQFAAISVAQLRPLMHDRDVAQTGQLVLKARRALEVQFV